MSAATIDRRLGPAKSRLVLHGKSHTKPGSLLKSRIPMRTRADHDENTPGYVKIDLVGHEGGNSRGDFCFTLTVTDIATGWTENRAVRTKAQVHVFAAITDVVKHLPFPIRGIDRNHPVRPGAGPPRREGPTQTPAHQGPRLDQPAAVQRNIQALCDELLSLATAKGQPARKPHLDGPSSGR